MWGNQTTFQKLRELERIATTLDYNEPILSRLTGGVYVQFVSVLGTTLYRVLSMLGS